VPSGGKLESGAEVRIDDIDQAGTYVGDPARTDDAGQFRIPALPAGRYMLTAGQGPLVGTLDQPVALAAAGPVQDLEIVVGPGLTIDGTVSSTSGTPIKRARIRLFGQGNRTGTHLFSDERGRYQFQGLVPGEYRLEVTAPGYKTFLVLQLPLVGADAAHANAVTWAPASLM